MKTIGIIGGIGPESTVDYYKEIIAAFHTKYSDLAYPEIIVYSVNMNELLKFIETKNWPELSGAEFSHGVCPKCMKENYPDLYHETDHS